MTPPYSIDASAPPTGRSPITTIALAYFGLFAAAVLALGHGAPGKDVLVGIAHLPFPLLSILVLRQARRASRTHDVRCGWWLITVGVFFGLIGDLVWLESDWSGDDVATAAYVLWDCAYWGFQAAGFVMMMRAQRARRERWTDWVDASVMTAAGGVLAWYLIARDVTRMERGDTEALLLFVLTAACNLSLLYLAAAVWLRGPTGVQRRAIGWMFGAYLLYVVADLVYERLEFTGTYVAGTWLELFYAGAAVALVLAADAQRRDPVGPPPRDGVPERTADWMPIVAGALALTPLALEAVRMDVAGARLGGVTIGLAVLTVLALARQRLSRREIDTLVATRIQLEQQLWQSQKMEAVGRLAGGIAHDFNNILASISSHAQLLRSANVGAGGDELEEIEFATQRAAALTRRLLGFSRSSPPDVKPLLLGEVTRSMEPMIARLLGPGITFRLDLGDAGVWIALADGQLEQILLNLAINARDAMPDGGHLDLATRRLRVHSDSPFAARGVLPGTWASVEVRDDGVGMDDATRARLFEPFFTTKARGHGTGLGLATVAGIVEAANGHVLVDSEVGRGTVMTVLLPIVPAAPERVSAAHPVIEETPSGGQRLVSRPPSATILIVEDEDAIRRALVRFLGRLDFVVVEATDGIDALRQLDGRAWKVDLVLTDVEMPGMNGMELAREIRKRDPALPIVYMSGFVGDHDGEAEPLAPTDTLMKPFDFAVLIERVRAALERGTE